MALIAVPDNRLVTSELLGGVGHCCAWHVRVPRGYIGFYVKWHKEISVSTGMSALGVADIPNRTLVFLYYFQL